MELLLKGKTAIVTGGGRGIGRASALHLAQLGACVAVVDDGSAPGGDGRDEAPATDVAAEIVARGGEAHAEVVDVTDEAQVDSLFARTLHRWESLDILVNVAGNIRLSTIVDATQAEWERVIRTHLVGTYLTSRRAAQHWVERASYGRLINFSSVAGLNVGYPALLSYSTAKAGIVGFTRACANFLVSYNVTANCITPTADTRMGDSVRGTEVPASTLRGGNQPEHVAPLVGFLASPAAANVTGRVLGARRARYVLWSEPAEERITAVDLAEDPSGLYAALGEMCADLSPQDLPASAGPIGSDWRDRYGMLLPAWDGHSL